MRHAGSSEPHKVNGEPSCKASLQSKVGSCPSSCGAEPSEHPQESEKECDGQPFIPNANKLLQHLMSDLDALKGTIAHQEDVFSRETRKLVSETEMLFCFVKNLHGHVTRK